MIYFIDEDIGQIGVFAHILNSYGYDTEIIENAQLAFTKLCKARNVELVFIDVMLADSFNISSRRYSREDTDSYQTTGLRLLEDLCKHNPNVFPLRAILLSQTSDPIILKQIGVLCQSKGIHYWKKNEFNDPFEFASRTNLHLHQLEV